MEQYALACLLTFVLRRFIVSEEDLDAAIKALRPLSQAPSLAYPEIVRSGMAEVLVGLLTHENADIVIDVVELIHELTDEDVGEEDVVGVAENGMELVVVFVVEVGATSAEAEPLRTIK